MKDRTNLRCSLRALLCELQDFPGAFLNRPRGNLATLDPTPIFAQLLIAEGEGKGLRAVHEIKGSPLVGARHLEIQPRVDGMVNRVHAEPVAHNKRVAAPLFPQDILDDVRIF